MKKVLFVTGRLGGGGSERVLTLIANEFHKKGYDVSIITFAHFENAYINSCPVVPLEFTNDLNQITNLRRNIKKVNPDVIIAFEYYVGMKTVLASWGLHKKVIISERNDPHKLDGDFVRKVLRDVLYGFADVLVFQTEDAKRYFSNRVQKKGVVICNPIKDGLPHWNKEIHNKIILNFCRLEKQKNLPLLINAFVKVHEVKPEYELHIYGEGNEYDNLMQLIRDKGLENCVKILPFSKNIHEIAKECAMFVSSSDYEGISNSMLEAMAIGLPVVCTDCPIGGARMVIDNGVNGILVPVKDEGAIVTAILSLIDNDIMAKTMSEEAKKIRKLYSLEKIVEKWEALL